MLAMLEKLINEHGSSSILRERLELFSDKYEMLEQKNKTLEENNASLENQLQAANKEIEKLRTEAASNSSAKLHENELKLLKYLFDNNHDFTAHQIASYLSIPIGNAEYHLDKLLEHNYIRGHLNMMTGTTYSISPEGRAYVIESGI